MNPSILFLITGEEVIGQIVKQTDDIVVLDGALSLYVTPNEDGTPIFYFKKYCMYVPNFFATFKTSDVMNIFNDPISPICKHYNESLKKFTKLNERLATLDVDDFKTSIEEDIDEDEDEDDETYITTTVH